MCVDVYWCVLVCIGVWDIDILYDYYKGNMPLKEDEAIALFENAKKNRRNGDQKGALKDALACLRAFKNLENIKRQSSCFSLIGRCYFRLGNYQDALKYHHKHLEIALQLGDKGGEGRAYCNIGNAHDSLGNYQDALKYHHKYLEIALQLGDKGGEGMAYGNIGNHLQV